MSFSIRTVVKNSEWATKITRFIFTSMVLIVICKKMKRNPNAKSNKDELKHRIPNGSQQKQQKPLNYQLTHNQKLP